MKITTETPETLPSSELALPDELPTSARVAICAPNGRGLADALVACWDRELVAVPLSPRTGERELRKVLQHSRAAGLIDGSGRFHPLERPDLAEDERTDRVDGEGLLIYTSGSTGSKKAVSLSRASVEHNARTTAQLHRFRPGVSHATCLPLYHCNALVMSLLGSHLVGADVAIMERFHPSRYFALIEGAGARTASIVPALIEELVADSPPWPDCLDYLITAAAPLRQSLAAAFYSRYGPRLRQGYGLTEATNFSFVMPSLDHDEFAQHYVHHHPPVGLPVGGTELRIVEGEVHIRSPHVMNGYWLDEAATVAVLDSDGWLRTGDLGELRDGYLVLSGRRKEVINRGGEKYLPIDVESLWEASGLTRPFAAVAIPDDTLGDEVGLWQREGRLDELKVILESSAVRPAAVHTGELLLTETGKPQRRLMGSQLRARRDPTSAYEALVVHAAKGATAIRAWTGEVSSGRARYIASAADRLVTLARTESVATSPRIGPAFEAIDLLGEGWPEIAAGRLSGEDLIRRSSGLWERLMCEWPMGSYAQHVVDVLTARDLLHGRVLELGSGVGNTTRLVHDHIDGEFIWTDQSPTLIARGQWKGHGAVVDFDRPLPPELGTFDVVIAVNALHCASDRRQTLRYLWGALNPDGWVVLGEGSSPTTSEGTPWALDYFFGLFDGWWDRGGFATRWSWLAHLREVGFDRCGFSRLSAGHHDLGGVLWARKPT